MAKQRTAPRVHNFLGSAMAIVYIVLEHWVGLPIHCSIAKRCFQKIADTVPPPIQEQRPAGAARHARVINAPFVVIALIAVLCVVHVARLVSGDYWNLWCIYAFALIPARFVDSSSYVQGSQIWS